MHKKLSAVLVFVIAAAVLGSGFAKVSKAAAGFAISAQGNSALQAGQSGSYSASVTDNGNPLLNGIVDLEVHDSSGAKVFQQYFSNQNFTTGQTQSYNIAWVPGGAGNYTLEVGVFAASWSSTLAWNSNALAMQVSPATPQFAATGNLGSSATVNQKFPLSVNLQDSGGAATNVIVDLEVHDSSGAKVFQQYFSNQNFTTGQTQSYSSAWTPGASNGAGTYSVNVGVFTGDWSSTLYWKDMQSISLTVPVAATFAASNFYVDPNSSAAAQALAWQYSDPADAARMDLIAAQPQATWFGGWNTNVTADVNALVSSAQKAGQVPILVAYNIPDRDCGGYSSGGAETASAYQTWMQQFAAGIGSRQALVVLEPDALAGMDCLSSADQATRSSLLAYAVQTLKGLGQTKVYLDAGNSNWISASQMATRLTGADIAQADGFSLNISNFYTTASNIQYGDAVSALVGGKHFVVDTSRNGAGSDGQWCNPPGMALGALPTTNTGNSLTDALLWIKPPGESDGTCNGGPAAGTWWPQYAAGLAATAGY